MSTPTTPKQCLPRRYLLLLTVSSSFLLTVGGHQLISGDLEERTLETLMPVAIALDEERPNPTALFAPNKFGTPELEALSLDEERPNPTAPSISLSTLEFNSGKGVTIASTTTPTLSAPPTLTRPSPKPTDTPLSLSEFNPNGGEVTITPTTTPTPSPVLTPTATQKPTLSPEMTRPSPRPPAVEARNSTRALVREVWDLRSLARMHYTTTRLFSSAYFPLEPNVAPYSFWDKFESPSFLTAVYYGYPLEGGGFEHYTVRTSPYFDDQEYLIVPNIRETRGPGAITFIWFAYKSSDDPNDSLYGKPGLMEWGRMGDVGNIRVYIDGQLAINAPITEFVGGQTIPQIKPLLWHHAKNGGNGCLFPIAYNRTIEVATTGCPRWFTIGVTRFLRPQQPFDSAQGRPFETLANHSFGTAEVEEISQLDRLWADPLIYPERIGSEQETRALSIPPGNSAEIRVSGSGTITALRFEAPQGVEGQLDLQMYWDREATPSVSLPFRALFGRPEETSPYQSFATGIVPGSGLLPLQKNLFYSNLPMPFQDGARIVMTNSGPKTARVKAVLYLDPQTTDTRFTVRFSPRVTLDPETPEYQPLSINGHGRLVGLMLHAAEFDYDAIRVDPPKGKWRFCFAEANITIHIDDNPPLYFSSWEDITGAGSYWNSHWN